MYETVELPPDKFDKKYGQINFYDPTQKENALGPEYIYKWDMHYYKKGYLVSQGAHETVMRRDHFEIICKSDMKLLGEFVKYHRSGGDIEMPSSQAAKFVKNWQITAQYIDPGVLADGILASAIPPVINPRFTMLQLQLNAWLNDQNILQDQSVAIYGYSLGGYLAAAVKQNYVQVTEAFLYNAPGVGGLQGNLTDAASDVLGLSSIATENIWNIRGSEGFPIIAGLGYQLGSPVSIQTEASANNHSISLLTDALAVSSAYSQLVPSLDQEQLSKLIDAFGFIKDMAGAFNSKMLESALDLFILEGKSIDYGVFNSRNILLHSDLVRRVEMVTEWRQAA